MRLHPQARLEAPDDLSQMAVVVMVDQERQRFRHGLHDERDQQQRRTGRDEHRLPSVNLDELLADQGGQDATDRIAAEHQRHHPTTDLLRRVFGHLRDDIGHHTSDAEAGEEAHDAERDRIVGESGRRGEDTEQPHADRNRPAATDLSASAPRNIAPNIIPNSAEPAMNPAVEASTPMSFMMEGARRLRRRCRSRQ